MNEWNEKQRQQVFYLSFSKTKSGFCTNKIIGITQVSSNYFHHTLATQVSYLNLELVHSLRSIDTAFSSGESAVYDVSCVKFGMLSDDKDLTDLVGLVVERGKEIEQSQKVRFLTNDRLFTRTKG